MNRFLNHIAIVAMCTAVAQSNGADLGVFTKNDDVGDVKHPGSTHYDPSQQVFEIAGSGENMWFDNDEFQFVYRKLSGDFILRSRARLIGEGIDPHRKMGWMIRSSLDANSAYVDAAVHGDGLTSMQYRRTKGAKTEQVESELKSPDVIELSRQGGKYVMKVARYGDPFSSEELSNVELGDEVYVGLFVCAHNADAVEKAVFENVRIIAPAAPDFQPYRDYIGGRVEVMEMKTGHREVVLTGEDPLEAPNWTRDDKALVVNRNGLLYRFDLSSREVTKIDTGFADQNNNDHVISFDGTRLGISHHTGEDRTSVVYTVPLKGPITGGVPKAITTLDADSYLHGWSPDDKFLIYTAQRNGDFDIYRIPSDGGEEVNLTKTAGLDDGSEYAPNGKTIYFNSSRSGKMQIWQMDADGGNQKRVTNDDYNNWFPHISPDGKSMVILSFDDSIDSDDHPFYKNVYIRLLEKQAGHWTKPKVIAYLYGGQGTINVPSWSPDGTRIAFVSNCDVAKIKQGTDASVEQGSQERPATKPKPRIIVTTDGEIDDECSMVRFLLYANEWDIEGIVTSSSQYHWQGFEWAGDAWIDPYLKAYREVYPNLAKHDPTFPTPQFLRERTKLGNVKAEGEMEEVTEGSELIVRILLDDSDPRPIWLQAWGGTNTIARALKTIQEKHPDRMAEVAKKIRLYCIFEQDATFQDYILPQWGKYKITTIISDQFEAFAYRWKKIQPPEQHKYFAAPWMKENILKGHGPLCSLYKSHKADEKGFDQGDFRSEGDSPAFLHNIVTGLRSMESPDWGGWGGRFVLIRDNTWMDPPPYEDYVHPEGRYFRETCWGRLSLNAGVTSHNDPRMMKFFKPTWRWSVAQQNDWAARADWCVQPFEKANHPPVVQIAHSADLKCKPGAKVSLSAAGTSDPDGDDLKYRWWQYQEADTYDGSVVIHDADQQDAWFMSPEDGKGSTVHIICEVTDAGSPPLTRYQRIVVEVK